MRTESKSEAAEAIPSIEDIQRNVAKRIRENRRPSGGALLNDANAEMERLLPLKLAASA